MARRRALSQEDDGAESIIEREQVRVRRGYVLGDARVHARDSDGHSG